MADRPSADRTAELLLRFNREPSRYRAEARRRETPPLDVEVVLKLALGRRVEFSAAGLNGPRAGEELKAAAIAFVRGVYFHPDANPYQTLGLAPGASQAAIRESFRLLMQLVHPDRQGAHKMWPDACAAQANHAYAMLRDHDTREKLEREAEARAALARAIHRAAAEAEATKMPVVTWLNKRKSGRRRGRKAVPHSLLPEWLTAGVGGYTRRNPSVAAFAILIGAAMIFIGVAALDRRDGMLVRGASGPRPSAETMLATMAPAPAREADTTPAVPELPKSPHAASSGLDSQLTAALAASGSSGALAPRGASGESPESIATPAAPDTARFPASRSFADISAASSISTAAASGTASVTVPTPSHRSAPTTPYVPAVTATVEKVEPQPPASEPPGTSAAMGAGPKGAEVAMATPAVASARAEPPSTVVAPAVTAPPATAEVEALFASFVDSYERGRLDAFTALFDADADTNLRRGRAAIRGEYDELFRLSQWRRMQLTRISWRPVGDRAIAKGEITVKIGWRDGHEVEQRLDVDMELMRRDGRVVIARLMHQPRTP